MIDLTFVTGNKAKAVEVQKILGFPITIKEIDLEEIQDTNVENVALNKVLQAYEQVKKPVIVDDVGLYINAWNTFPGALIKWFLKASEGNAELLLKMMEGESNRSAVARLAIAFYDGTKPSIFVGETQGIISAERKGENGFGWDPVFIPDGYTKTYAQMTPEEKREISHRRKGLDKLKEFLNSQNRQ